MNVGIIYIKGVEIGVVMCVFVIGEIIVLKYVKYFVGIWVEGLLGV